MNGVRVTIHAMADIVINASPSKLYDVELVGVEYKVRAPKMAVLATVAKTIGGSKGKKGKQGEGAVNTLRHLEDLVKIMFKADASAVLKRLEDPEDDLDYQHIMDTAEALIEAATGNPTSSQPDSTPQ